jgi:SPP1 family predicted phage head-tail adaptor
MRAGTLDRRVTVLRRVQVGETPLNEPIFEWQEVRTVWAAKVHKSEDEKFAASQVYAQRVVTFRTRFMSDLAETDRLVCDGLTYNLKGIRELGRRDGLEVAAEWQS